MRQVSEEIRRRRIIMIKYIDVTKKPSQDQIKMLNMASAIPVSENDEYLELSKEELLQFKKVANRGGDENDR